MKAKTVRYERLFNLGDYEHEKVCIEVEVMEGESAASVAEMAKQWCEVNSEHLRRERKRIEGEVADDKIITRERLTALQKRREQIERMVANVEASGLVG